MKVRIETPFWSAVLCSIIAGAGALPACGSDESPDGTGGSGGGASDAGEDAAMGGSGGGAPDANLSGGSGGQEVPDAALDAPDGQTPFQHLTPYPPVKYPALNPEAADKAMLGKILFWEEQIGEDDTMACGTCHRAASGGSDPRAAEIGARVPGLLDDVIGGPAVVDTVLDPSPGLDSNDVRGAQGVKACTESDGVITYTDPSAPVQVTGRKPPTYLDAMFALELFWDGRAKRDWLDPDGLVYFNPAGPSGETPLSFMASVVDGTLVGYALESQAVGPPTNDMEMACSAQTWADINARLRTVQPLAKTKSVPNDMKEFIVGFSGYPEMFAAVFGNTIKSSPTAPDDEINTARIAFAIATHERRLTSEQTPWDAWNAGDDAAMTPNQVKGFELFMTKGKCNACHAPPHFTNFAFHFIGFHEPKWDQGRRHVDPAAVPGSMKTPTLRNVGLREAGGLLHRGDGPGKNLQTVMDLYNTGGRRTHPDIAAAPIDLQIVELGLTSAEIDQIIDFMRNGLTDPRVQAEAPPFDRPKLGSEP